MYKKLPGQLESSKLEKEILEFWNKENIFKKSVEERDPENAFIFFEGPPTANGRPGIHHVIARTVKDAVCRLKTMQGYRVERKAGWDTHGLPVEIEVEKQLGIDGKSQIEEYGVAEFCDKCRTSVWGYKSEWDELTKRMGYWVDLDNPYITYTNDYIETVWWILKEFWKKDLIYQGFKILPYCPHCETPLSSHEVSQGYKDVKDPSVYVKAKIKDQENTSFLVWTTTPWTLISNVALALSADIEYVKIKTNDEYLILAKERLVALKDDYEIVEEYMGSDLQNIDYEPFFDFVKPDKRAHYTVLADFVTTSDGSGIVHMAPAFGEDDYQTGLKYDLPVVQPVDKKGQFTDEVTPWAGTFVKDADVDIIVDLKHRGIMYKSEKYEHSYPHCWRCDSPLLYYARKSWYIRTTAIKDKLIESNNNVNWFPKEVGSGRFGQWLENNIDWSLSRDRFWGTPLPVWKCDNEDCDHMDCVGSIKELQEKGIETIADDIDLHKPHIDDIHIKCEKCGSQMTRTHEVIDAWFDSGSMPYAQWHYPFENKEIFDKAFPANFISEGVDQTRGWFYTLLVIGTFLFGESPYKSCVSLGHILDKDGQKMSKSKGNAVNPFEVFESHGADALRWYLLSVSPPWLPTRFDIEGVTEVSRKFIGTLYNTYSFFVMYANIDEFTYDKNAVIPVEKRSELDQWISSALYTLVESVNENLEKFDLTKVVREISDFVNDDLSNWYVRRSRRRFWKSEMGDDKMAAFQTLYESLMVISKLIAPIAPFIAEEIYKNLTSMDNDALESVHLCEYPATGKDMLTVQNKSLEEKMNLVRNVVNLGRSLRNETALKVRQPLAKILVVAKDDEQKAMLKSTEALIADELNIKTIDFVDDAGALMSRKAMPVFKNLGPKFGKLVNKAAAAIKELDEEKIDQLLSSGITLEVEGVSAELVSDDINIETENKEGLVAGTENDVTVALDTVLTQQLVEEGLAREFVNRVQNMRKDADFEVTDRIKIAFNADDEFTAAINNMGDYIKSETLCDVITPNSDQATHTKEWNINDKSVNIGIDKA